MKTIPLIAMLHRPRTVCEVALAQPEGVAVVVNAVAGMFLVAAIYLPLLSLFTGSLVALLTVLFGPLAGFVLSSLYARVEWTVGKRLGGRASLDDLYRLFAWSFLPLTAATLLYALILIPLDKPSTATELVAAIPSLIITLFALRTYWSNIIALQQFSRVRGSVCMAVTGLLFLVLIAGCGACLNLLFQYGMPGGMTSLPGQP